MLLWSRDTILHSIRKKDIDRFKKFMIYMYIYIYAESLFHHRHHHEVHYIFYPEALRLTFVGMVVPNQAWCCGGYTVFES